MKGSEIFEKLDFYDGFCRGMMASTKDLGLKDLLSGLADFICALKSCSFECTDDVPSKGKDANIVSEYVYGNVQYQGRIGIPEMYPNEDIVCAFAEGAGDWSCYRFGDGKRKYKITVMELEDGE